MHTRISGLFFSTVSDRCLRLLFFKTFYPRHAPNCFLEGKSTLDTTLGLINLNTTQKLSLFSSQSLNN